MGQVLAITAIVGGFECAGYLFAQDHFVLAAIAAIVGLFGLHKLSSSRPLSSMSGENRDIASSKSM